jgi:hypothetical protein
MTEEQQARDLLLRATRLPDEIEPPVQHLIKQGRQRRKLRSARRTLATAAAAVLAIVTPLVIGTISLSSPPAEPSKPDIPNVFPQLGSGPDADGLAKFTWSALPPSPLGPRDKPLLTVAGPDVLELGGLRNDHPVNDGAAFNLKTGRWSKIAAVPGSVGFDQAVSVWTGRELFVTDGVPEFCKAAHSFPPEVCTPHAGLYDPVHNRWSTTQLPRAMDGLDPVAAVWSGRLVVLAALDAAHGDLVVGAYAPATGRWQIITPHLPAGHPPSLIRMVATSEQVVMWSGWLVNKPSANDAGIDVFAFPDNRPDPVHPWRNVAGNWPQYRNLGPPIYTGNAILFPPAMHWCSICGGDYHVFNGFFVISGALDRTVSVRTGPFSFQLPAFVWTGRLIIAVVPGSGNPLPFKLTDLAEYNPSTSAWRPLAASPRDAHTDTLPVWTGSELLVVTEQGTVLALHR